MKPGTMVGDDHKVCLGCHETKPLTEYYRNKGGLAGRQSRCRPCFYKQIVAPSGAKVKKAARHAVERAIKTGRLVRPSHCSVCRAEAYTHGHHDDYLKALEVRWLCKPCHEEHHRGDKNERHDLALKVAS